MNHHNDFRVVEAGDSVLCVEFEERIDEELNARAVGVAERIHAAGIAGVLDVVPTFRTVAVYFDPLAADVEALRLRLDVEARRGAGRAKAVEPGMQHEIPVSYGGSDGPDLAAVASAAGLSEEAVVSLHTADVYRVFMLGFLPGFAYMAPIDSRIALPRRATPRPRVPAGSVAIAERQTGIYPMDSPGGWHLIGRTDVKLVDSDRADPFLFKPGDHVRFTALQR